MQKLNPNNIKVLRLYIAFLHEVLNDEAAKELEDKVKYIEN